MPSEKYTYHDSFEQLLQEAADRFRLYPSPKIWQSLYNNIHPEKKLPSISSWLLIFYCFLLLSAPSAVQYENKKNQLTQRLPIKGPVYLTAKDIRQASETPWSFAEKKNKSSVEKTVIEKDAFPAYRIAEKKQKDNPYIITDENTESKPLIETGKTDYTDPLIRPDFGRIYAGKEHSEEPEIQRTSGKSPETNSRFQYQLYATPSMEFRGSHKGDRNSESGISTSESPDGAASHSAIAAFNIEAGGNIIFRVNTDIRFKAGLQVNYSNRQVQPDEDAEAYTGAESFIASADPMKSISGQEFSAESYQFSIPLGADWMIAGNDAIQWFAGATVQPSFSLGGNNSLVVYGPEAPAINDKGALRNFNLNGGIETFVSFKTPGGITLNAGPQFRYQMLSSYKNMHPFNERLFNIGLKLGITSPF